MNSLIVETIMLKEFIINDQEVGLSNLSFYTADSQPVNDETIFFNKIFDTTTNPITSDYGDIAIFRTSKYFIAFRVEKINCITHNGSFIIDFIINDSIVKSISYGGIGFLNPSYGFENIYFSEEVTATEFFKFKFRNVNNILNIISSVTLITIPLKSI